MSSETPVDPAALREEVKSKYREVALNPHGEFHFHTEGLSGPKFSQRLISDETLWPLFRPSTIDEPFTPLRFGCSPQRPGRAG